jgi:hypothetical protein
MMRKPLCLFFCAAFWLLATPARSQTAGGNGPIQREKLLAALETAQRNGAPIKSLTQRLIGEIRRRGVDFLLDEQVESQLRAVGARPELLTAVRRSFRTKSAAGKSESASRRSAPPPPAPATSGPAFAFDEIAGWLRMRTNSVQLQQAIQARGAAFVLQSWQRTQLVELGAGEELLRAVRVSATREALRAEYERLVSDAALAIDGNRWAAADELLHQALELDSAPPRAHSLHALVKLYGQADFGAAEQEMRAAIQAGGEAMFWVSHDCDDRNCGGLLTISRTVTAYRPPSGHPFEVYHRGIKDAGVNGWKGSENGWFHIRLPNKNYNFQPHSRSTREAELVIRLIYSFRQ